jgi:hypothetical protein
MKIKDSWFGLEGTNNDHPFLIRGRDELADFIRLRVYQTRIDMCWTYRSDDASKMPDEEDMQLMENVENLLVEKLEEDLQSILALVYTGNNQRVWYWYSKSSEEAIKRINSALSSFPKLLIEFFSCLDPDWEEYNGVID